MPKWLADAGLLQGLSAERRAALDDFARGQHMKSEARQGEAEGTIEAADMVRGWTLQCRRCDNATMLQYHNAVLLSLRLLL